VGGASHAAVHLFTAFLCGWCGAWLATEAAGLASGSASAAVFAGVFTLVVGGVAGSVVLGIYLLLSLRVFGRHANEAFSSLRIADYKQWLRLCIEKTGALRIHAIGIRRVPRHWTRESAAPQPADARASTPHLIEMLRLIPTGEGRYRVDTIAGAPPPSSGEHT
jgi:hypothetical protein